MKKSFSTWARKIASLPLEDGITAWVTESEISSNPSTRLDIDTPTAVARITYWESDDYDAEIIDLESEKVTFSCQGRLALEQDFSLNFSDFFQCLGINIQQIK